MNAFEQLADTQRSAFAKRQDKRLAKLVVASDADAPMIGTLQEREQQRQAKQLRLYRAWLREKKQALLNGPHSREIRGLAELLDTLSPTSAGGLVKYVQGCAWLTSADAATKREVLSLVSTAISDFRQTQGLAPFDDSLPGEDPTAFEQIRTVLAERVS